MVARLELSKDKANAGFSADVISDSQDTVLNAFPVALPEHMASEIDGFAQKSTRSAIQAVEV